jgi:hypothetical protein
VATSLFGFYRLILIIRLIPNRLLISQTDEAFKQYQLLIAGLFATQRAYLRLLCYSKIKNEENIRRSYGVTFFCSRVGPEKGVGYLPGAHEKTVSTPDTVPANTLKGRQPADMVNNITHTNAERDE